MGHGVVSAVAARPGLVMSVRGVMGRSMRAVICRVMSTVMPPMMATVPAMASLGHRGLQGAAASR
jgi:hypothetical protein